MIALANNELPEDPEPSGVLGDGALRPGKYNMALARRAIREDWPISPEVRRALVEQMAAVVTSEIRIFDMSDGDEVEDVIDSTVRNKIAAAKVLVAADAVNAKREAMDQADEHITMRKNVHHTHEMKVSEMTDEDLQAVIQGRFVPLNDNGDDV